MITVNPLDGKKVRISDVAKVHLLKAVSATETRANDEQAVLMSVLARIGCKYRGCVDVV